MSLKRLILAVFSLLISLANRMNPLRMLLVVSTVLQLSSLSIFATSFDYNSMQLVGIDLHKMQFFESSSLLYILLCTYGTGSTEWNSQEEPGFSNSGKM
jgi:hypothetical protein